MLWPIFWGSRKSNGVFGTAKYSPVGILVSSTGVTYELRIKELSQTLLFCDEICMSAKSLNSEKSRFWHVRQDRSFSWATMASAVTKKLMQWLLSPEERTQNTCRYSKCCFNGENKSSYTIQQQAGLKCIPISNSHCQESSCLFIWMTWSRIDCSASTPSKLK